MKRLLFAIAAMAIMTQVTGCYTTTHTVGTGAAGSTIVRKQQWYALAGAIRINSVDSKDLAGGAQNYNVKTQFRFSDVLISIITGFATINVQTVTVTK